jgi:hypothetical protein
MSDMADIFFSVGDHLCLLNTFYHMKTLNGKIGFWPKIDVFYLSYEENYVGFSLK